MNRTVEDLVFKFVADNPGSNWVKSVPFVQFTYNTRRHDGTQKTPYELVYGSEPRLGLASLGIPEAVLSALIADMDTSPNGRNEEELLQVLEGMGVEGDAITYPSTDSDTSVQPAPMNIFPVAPIAPAESVAAHVLANLNHSETGLDKTQSAQHFFTASAPHSVAYNCGMSVSDTEMHDVHINGETALNTFGSNFHLGIGVPTSVHDLLDIEFQNPEFPFQELVDQSTEQIELLNSPLEEDAVITQRLFEFPPDYLRRALLPPPQLQGVFETIMSEPVLPSLPTVNEPTQPQVHTGHFTVGMGGEIISNPVSPDAQQNSNKSPFVSPRRALLRNEALKNLVKQARKMQHLASKQSTHDIIPVGTVVRIAAPDVDRARGDPTSIVAIIVETTRSAIPVWRAGIPSLQLQR